MAVRGHALAGDARAARTLLDEAEALIRQAAEHADDAPVWMYFYDETWFRLQRGMTEPHLANWPKAIDLLMEGLSGLPETYKRDRAWYGSCLARAHAEAGDAWSRTATTSRRRKSTRTLLRERCRNCFNWISGKTTATSSRGWCRRDRARPRTTSRRPCSKWTTPNGRRQAFDQAHRVGIAG
ncbi:hypothetical protein AB0J63_27955 [Streptosporangium canum]|uniref:hypothetical protein n=1 Tax=Streptosporangium canum TaxID=324952 RepID=UPI00343F163B